MNLQDLKKEIPYKWRAWPWWKQLAYIDSRNVQDLLDEVCWPENWQVKYEEHKWNLFASIWIYADSNWVWKSDCWTESNIEKEKGEASDAFKRAWVMWGIWRFLYSLKPKAWADKWAWAEKKFEDDPDKKWFNETNLQNMKNNLPKLKETYKTWAELVKHARDTYKVSKAFAVLIEALY